MSSPVRVTHTTVEVGGFAFDCLACGPQSGEPVLLLHGFPQTAECWREVMRELGTAGYHCIAPTQRGFAASARPLGTAAYRPSLLIADALGVAAHLGAGPFHLVGHDLGGLLGWLMAAQDAPMLRSLSVLSTPHPAAFARSMLRSGQAARSAYMPVFRLPAVPERLLALRGGAGLYRFLRAGGLDEAWARRYAGELGDRDALAAAINWYRAWPVGLARTAAVQVPTLYVWGTRDVALGRRAAEDTADYVRAQYTFHPLDGAGHWLPEMHAGAVARLLLGHLGR